MYYPTRLHFQDLAHKGNQVPVYRELNVDLETPVSVFLKLRGQRESFLLESVEGGEQLARYSFIGAYPSRVFTAQGEKATLRNYDSGVIEDLDFGNPLDALRSVMNEYRAVHLPGLPRFMGGAVGFFSYEMVRHFERVRNMSSSPAADSESGTESHTPDAVFLLTDSLIAFDHVKHRALIIANVTVRGDLDAAYDDAVRRIEEIVDTLRQPLAPESGNLESAQDARSNGKGSRGLGTCGTHEESQPHFSANGHTLQSNISPEEFAAIVKRAQEHIASGDIFQVVLSQRFQRGTDVEPFNIYRALRRLNPSPYMFFLDLGEIQFIGSSPELLVRLEDGVAQLNPIAGTRVRGKDQEQDAALEAELRADPKERAEHVMLVDLGRNDLGRVCEYGSVQVPDFMTVERYSHVMHLVSRVTGRLRQGLDSFDLLRATFPAGTVSGAPKARAMEIIQELEGTRRGPYAGAVGYFGFPTADNSGNMDFCITIRTIVMRGREASIQAGAGIVADSIPEQEHQECLNKARALAESITIAESEDR